MLTCSPLVVNSPAYFHRRAEFAAGRTRSLTSSATDAGAVEFICFSVNLAAMLRGKCREKGVPGTLLAQEAPGFPSPHCRKAS
jgi:hypothetical protein